MIVKLKRKPLDEQVVVVFGASSGIGRETAKQLASRGATVVVSARTDEGLDSLVAEINAAGRTALAMPADATVFAEVQGVADQTVAQFGRLDTWAHVAGVALYGLFDEVTPDEFKRVIDTDLTGLAYGAMAALPHLKRDGGAFIGVSSVLAARSVPMLSAYCAAKHGAAGLLESLRIEMRYEKAPVSVTNIMPSSINTTFFNKAKTKMGVKPRGIPPISAPDLVANAICYAAEHPARDLIVGDAGKQIVAMQRLSPRLLDWLLTPTVAIKAQQSREPKAASDDNNLFAPVTGYERAEGDSSSFPFSVTDWLDQHPAVRRGAFIGGTIGAVALATVRSKRKDQAA